MLLFSLLQQLEPTFKPKETKIHLARFNGSERPIDVFIAERFDQWQSWQSRKNFSRQFVLSLIDAGAGRWLYVGLFRSIGCDDNSHAFVPQGNWSKRTGPTRCSRARSVLLKQRLPLSSRGRMIDGWLAGGYRLKGELLEKMNRPAEAIEAYRAALGLDSKIGVKKRLAAMEKAASQKLLLEAGAEQRAVSAPRSDGTQS
jgi:hypothetical protein